MIEDNVRYKVQLNGCDWNWKLAQMLGSSWTGKSPFTDDLAEARAYVAECNAIDKSYSSINVYRIIKVTTTFEELDV